MKEKIMPSVVVTLVCAIVCGLLAAVNAATADRIVQAEADKVQRSLAAVFGEDTYTQLEESFENVDGVSTAYRNSKNVTIYDISADGYAKGGIRVLVGIAEDGSVAGVGFVSCGETAGIGTRVTESSYLAGFTGATGEMDYPDMISGATFSSKGLRSAVKLAQACYAGFPGTVGGEE